MPERRITVVNYDHATRTGEQTAYVAWLKKRYQQGPDCPTCVRVRRAEERAIIKNFRQELDSLPTAR